MQSCGDQTVFTCALEDDVEGLREMISNSLINEEQILSETDAGGRNVLSFACMLNRSSFVREVVKICGDVNTPTTRGYSPLHYSAMWGHLDTLKTLVELGADMQAVNFRGERAIDVAHRYSKLDCADYLAWAEAKQRLEASITRVKDILADPEKIQGKLNKEDKNTCINACTAKSDWIQNVKNPTVQDFIEQKKQFEDVLSPVLAKLTAQPETPSKKNRN